MCREEKFMLYITLLFAFRVPWGWTYTAGTVADLKKAYVKKSY